LRIANISAVGDVAVGLIGNSKREVMDVKNTLSKGILFTVFLPGNNCKTCFSALTLIL
jgi:hypothetical protein